MAVLCRDGQVHGASAMAGLAAALAAKGAAETMEGVCRKSIMCERIGDARHRPCAEASSVPLDYLVQAQDTLRYEGSMTVLSVWGPLRSERRRGAGAGGARSKKRRWMTAVRQIWGLRALGRGQQARDGVPEQVNRCFCCSAVSSSSRFAQASATCIPAMKRPRHSRTVL